MRVIPWDEFINQVEQPAWYNDHTISQRCHDIINRVRSGGDQAVRELTEEIDGVRVPLELEQAQWDQLADQVGAEERGSLEVAAQRIREFHQCQLRTDWMQTSEGIIAGQMIRPVDRTGVYVPGGRASYPSSVLMCVVPAVVAGVGEIVVCTPPDQQGMINPLTALACKLTGVARIFLIGGAQAIAALAMGTETVPQVDVVCGPGNVWVMMAKRLVRGLVGTDADAGPSELLVIADEDADPVWAAWDLLAQAEHDPDARLWVVTMCPAMAKEIIGQVQVLSQKLSRRQIIDQAMDGAIVTVAEDLEAAAVGANAVAAEHVSLHVREPWQLVPHIKSAGSIVIGGETPVALGDYVGGPNHVLPTGGTARFSSALGVDTFLKRCNLLYAGRAGTSNVGEDAVTLALAEGLTAHAGSVQARLREDNDDL